MERSEDLGKESIGKLLLRFSIPAVIGMVVNSLYIIIDRIFIGRVVGAMAISGVSLTFPIGIIIMGFGMLIGVGGSACISIRLGQNRKDEAEKILGNSFILLIVISILVTIVLSIFIDPILKSFGASANTIEYARQFISIIIYASVIQNLGFGLNNIIRAEGNPKKAMMTALIGAPINILLDYIFICVLGFKIRGAAIATVISQTITCIWVVTYFLGNNSMLKLKKENFKLEKNIVSNIIAIGMAPFAMQVASSAVNIILNKSLAVYGGDLAIGAMGIISGISTLVLMPIFGINQGAQPIIGFNYGANKYKRVKKTLIIACIVGTLISSAGSLVVQIAPTALVQLFNKNDANLTNITVHGLKIYMLMFAIVGFQIVSSNFFQAIGKAKTAMFLGLSRQVIVLIPMIIILPHTFKLDGVWMAAPISDFIASIITAVFLLIEVKRLNCKEESENLEQASTKISLDCAK
ncbi:MATE family efflux transporter [Clostridium sp. JN-1]|jgi:putative MATE family efflux protein|uniref:MATE family efflux transporter n=1 Tax=Clostridium sp. JN-1 TaxID=2483110 RepID=UPI000F0B2999|nr:MATE family efflux transporter [Clostridium sp. JN-1]